MNNDAGARPDGTPGTTQVTVSGSVSPFQNLAIEDRNIVLLSEALLHEAETFIAACQNCSDFAEISFDYLLDAITGCDPSLTEYVLPHPGRCPQCAHLISEKTLVVPV